MKSIPSALVNTVILLTAILFLHCNDDVISPSSLNDLETHFFGGYISADLMPLVPPDPITCQLVLIAKNKSSSASLIGLGIPRAEVFRDSTNVRLGTISFSTSWNGRLGPNEQDTVRLTKVVSPASLFTPPCGKYLYLNVMIKDGSNDSTMIKINSLFFSCTF